MNMEHAGKPAGEFEITLEQSDAFEFRVRFDKPQHADLLMDEPGPLGKDAAPNPARILSAAIGTCLSASLLFCANKSGVPVGPIRTRVRMHLVRNERGRLRVSHVDVNIDPHVAESDRENARRCMSLFEDFCVVTQSVREGIQVNVAVEGLEQAAPAAISE